MRNGPAPNGSCPDPDAPFAHPPRLTSTPVVAAPVPGNQPDAQHFACMAATAGGHWWCGARRNLIGDALGGKVPAGTVAVDAGTSIGGVLRDAGGRFTVVGGTGRFAGVDGAGSGIGERNAALGAGVRWSVELQLTST